VEELVEKTQWTSLVERSDITGDTRNPFGVNSAQRWSHVLQLTENLLLPGTARTMGEGLVRLRLFGGLTPEGWRRVTANWERSA
jgi:allantoicase